MYQYYVNGSGDMTIQTIKRWGNSLAVRIPANLADELHLREDQEVDLTVSNGVLIATPAIKTFSWDEYRDQLVHMPQLVQPTLDWGNAVGTELADPAGQDEW